MNSIRLFLSTVVVFIVMLFVIPCSAEQHPSVQRILLSVKKCLPNQFFSSEQINSKDSGKETYTKALERITSDGKPFTLTRDYFLLPVNKCVLRGSRDFELNEDVLVNSFNVKTIINTDFLVNNLKKKPQDINYVYLAMSASQYPRKSSLTSLLKALDYLSTATPNGRVIISCFFGRHRTGLIAGIYQFLGEYAKDSKATCKNLGGKNDLVYNQMLNLGKGSGLIYDMPQDFKKFYVDFGKSVCEEKSKEFIEKLL